ncbi:hypothetical protein Godav_000941 [Gossypium davidsonii]|uniref:Uncharacterized protein n=1 Tax=Gossypium davidsonii TaxID=34287 RepID=A0A7J8T1Q8_GOSDV|nr:hypothetical protein [Gossypium davidsonii]
MTTVLVQIGLKRLLPEKSLRI